MRFISNLVPRNWAGQPNGLLPGHKAGQLSGMDIDIDKNTNMNFEMHPIMTEEEYLREQALLDALYEKEIQAAESQLVTKLRDEMRKHYRREEFYVTDLYYDMFRMVAKDVEFDDVTGTEFQIEESFWFMPVQHPIAGVLYDNWRATDGDETPDRGVYATDFGSFVIYDDRAMGRCMESIAEMFKENDCPFLPEQEQEQEQEKEEKDASQEKEEKDASQEKEEKGEEDEEVEHNNCTTNGTVTLMKKASKMGGDGGMQQQQQQYALYEDKKGK